MLSTQTQNRRPPIEITTIQRLNQSLSLSLGQSVGVASWQLAVANANVIRCSCGCVRIESLKRL